MRDPCSVLVAVIHHRLELWPVGGSCGLTCVGEGLYHGQAVAIAAISALALLGGQVVGLVGLLCGGHANVAHSGHNNGILARTQDGM